MTQGASEGGIHMSGNPDDLWAPEHCEHVDAHGGCILPYQHEGDHKYAHDPLEDIEDPVEAFIEENER